MMYMYAANAEVGIFYVYFWPSHNICGGEIGNVIMCICSGAEYTVDCSLPETLALHQFSMDSELFLELADYKPISLLLPLTSN